MSLQNDSHSFEGNALSGCGSAVVPSHAVGNGRNQTVVFGRCFPMSACCSIRAPVRHRGQCLGNGNQSVFRCFSCLLNFVQSGFDYSQSDDKGNEMVFLCVLFMASSNLQDKGNNWTQPQVLNLYGEYI